MIMNMSLTNLAGMPIMKIVGIIAMMLATTMNVKKLHDDGVTATYVTMAMIAMVAMIPISTTMRMSKVCKPRATMMLTMVIGMTTIIVMRKTTTAMLLLMQTQR